MTSPDYYDVPTSLRQELEEWFIKRARRDFPRFDGGDEIQLRGLVAEAFELGRQKGWRT